MNKPKLIITGHAESGKDTICEILKILGYSFESSSHFVNKKCVFPVLRNKYGYKSPEECYLDRRNHRKEWFDLICEYNKRDLARLGREIFADYDIYCGLRNIDELRALEEEKLFNYLIWVDAGNRVPLEDSSSMTITKDLADLIIKNDKGFSNLLANLGEALKLWESAFYKHF